MMPEKRELELPDGSIMDVTGATDEQIRAAVKKYTSTIDPLTAKLQKVPILGDIATDTAMQIKYPGDVRSRGEATALKAAGLLPDAASLAASVYLPGSAAIVPSSFRVGLASMAGKVGEMAIKGGMGEPMPTSGWDAALELGGAGAAGLIPELVGRSVGRGIAFFAKPNASFGAEQAKRLEFIREIGISPTPDEASSWKTLQMIRSWADRSAKGAGMGQVHNLEARAKFEDIVIKNLRDFGSPPTLESAIGTGTAIKSGINAPVRGVPPEFNLTGTYQNFQKEVGTRAFEGVNKQADDAGVVIDLKDAVLNKLQEMQGRNKKLKDIFPTALPENDAVSQKIQDLTRNVQRTEPVLDKKSGRYFDKLVTEPVDTKVSFRDAHAWLTTLGQSDEPADKELYGLLKTKLQETANANGFGKDFTKAMVDYREGKKLFFGEVLPGLLAKDPEKLIKGMASATETEWTKLKDALLRYDTGVNKVGRPVWDKVQRQVVQDIFMAPGNGSLLDVTRSLDRLDRYGPKVQELIFDTPEGKQLLENTRKIADAASSFRNLNPRGTPAGEKLLTSEMQGAQMALGGATMAAVGGASGSGGLLARGQTLLLMGMERVGIGPAMAKIAYSPTATKYLTEGLKELNRGAWTKAGGLFAQAGRLAHDSGLIREYVLAGAEAEAENALTGNPLEGKMAKPTTQ